MDKIAALRLCANIARLRLRIACLTKQIDNRLDRLTGEVEFALWKASVCHASDETRAKIDAVLSRSGG